MTEQGRWISCFFRRKEVWKTTWKARLLIIVLIGTGFFLVKGAVLEGIGESLVCKSTVASVDAAVLMNFDTNYLLFEETEKLVRAGKVQRVFVPVNYNRKRTGPNGVSAGFVEVMARIARIKDCELILVDEQEPIRYSAALQVREHLLKQGIHSVVVVSPGFSSRRDFLIYQTLLEPAGVEVSCLPVFTGSRTPDTWSDSWHGIQEVFLEIGKLLYYELVVL